MIKRIPTTMRIRTLLSLIAIAGLGIAGTISGYIAGSQKPVEIRFDTIYLERPLTEWQVFQLALIEVESEYNDTTNFLGAVGCLQLTDSYVREVNRITDYYYQLNDAHDAFISLCIFNHINDAYNEMHDIHTAIKLHNPEAGEWYMNRVLKAMDNVRNRERYRSVVLDF